MSCVVLVAVMVAAFNGHSAVVDSLIRAKADLNARAEKGQTGQQRTCDVCGDRHVDGLQHVHVHWHGSDVRCFIFTLPVIFSVQP